MCYLRLRDGTLVELRDTAPCGRAIALRDLNGLKVSKLVCRGKDVLAGSAVRVNAVVCSGVCPPLQHIPCILSFPLGCSRQPPRCETQLTGLHVPLYAGLPAALGGGADAGCDPSARCAAGVGVLLAAYCMLASFCSAVGLC